MTSSDEQFALDKKRVSDENEKAERDSTQRSETKQAKAWNSKTLLKRWTVYLAATYGLVVLLLVIAEPYLVYPALLAEVSDNADPSFVPRGFLEKQELVAEDGVHLDAIHYCPEKSSMDSRGVFLLCHGNGEWIGKMTPLLVAMGDRFNVSVFCFDYRGFGLSEGFPSETGILKDADAAYKKVISLGYPPEKIIIFGRSIGGGPSCYLASRYETRGLILHNTFSSLVDVAASKFVWLPVRWIMRNRFDSATRLSDYDGPLLQSHGTDDQVVPIRFGQRLFDAAGTDSINKEFLTQENAGHNDPISLEFQQKIITLLDRLLGNSR